MSYMSRFLGRCRIALDLYDEHGTSGWLTEELSVSRIRSSYLASSSQAPFPPNRASACNAVFTEPPRPSNPVATWLILQPADIWDNQIKLAIFLCDAVVGSPDLPGWALE